MLVLILLLCLGFVLLIKGADWLVTGASSLARKYKVSDLAIGLTIVAFGTSAPELVVNVVASAQNHSDIVFGNIIGSNNFNLFIILGIAGLIYPIRVQSGTVWREIPISFLAILVLYLLVHNAFLGGALRLSVLDGGVLFLFFLGFLGYVYRQMKSEVIQPEVPVRELSSFRIWALIAGGLAGLVIGGRIVVNNAVELATIMGVSEKVIGLTILAAGTSLPELVTSVVAALKKNSDIAIGNVIGSNVFNVFLILAVSSFVRPVTFNPSFDLDIWIHMAGTGFLFVAMFTGARRRLDRWEAGLLFCFFIAYTVYLIEKIG